MQKALNSITAEKPLIFVIDDLDRCNPSFAIKTLEVVKHLLDIENTIYIFALDMHQMRAAIKKFYGQDIDADGYLCKVFDYITLLPAPYPGQYVSLAFSRINSNIEKQEKEFFSFASKLLCEHHCSLRLIDSIITTFSLLWNTFLSDHNCSQAYILYFFTLFLKFRYPLMYHTLSQTSTNNCELTNELISFGHNNETISALANLYSCKIENSTLDLHLNDTVETICSFEVTGPNQIVYISSSYTVSCNLSQNDSINRLLFFDDLKRFSEIKHLTYEQYIHRQLEMYNPPSQ